MPFTKLRIVKPIPTNYYHSFEDLMKQQIIDPSLILSHRRPTPITTDLIPLYWKPVSSGTVLRYLNIDEDLQMEVKLSLEQHYSIYKPKK